MRLFAFPRFSLIFAPKRTDDIFPEVLHLSITHALTTLGGPAPGHLSFQVAVSGGVRKV